MDRLHISTEAGKMPFDFVTFLGEIPKKNSYKKIFEDIQLTLGGISSKESTIPAI